MRGGGSVRASRLALLGVWTPPRQRPHQQATSAQEPPWSPGATATARYLHATFPHATMTSTKKQARTAAKDAVPAGRHGVRGASVPPHEQDLVDVALVPPRHGTGVVLSGVSRRKIPHRLTCHRRPTRAARFHHNVRSGGPRSRSSWKRSCSRSTTSGQPPSAATSPTAARPCLAAATR